MKGHVRSFVKKRWVDLAVILTLVLSIAGIFLIQYLPSSPSSLQASIIRENEVIKEIDLSRLSEEEVKYMIDGAEGPMRVVAKHNAIRVAESGCPSQYCVNTGWVTMPGRSIICLYNKVMINVKSLDASLDVEI